MKSFVAVILTLAIAAGCSQDDGLITGPDVDVADATSSLEASSSSEAVFKHRRTAEYEVTIVNMTHSQPFSPGVIVTHNAAASLFSVGSAASEGIREIAENGNPTPAFDALTGAAGVADVVDTAAPVFTRNGPGSNKLTATIRTSGDARYLSMAVMLICTNDGFVGLDSVKLPRGPKTAVYFPRAYDAGTEANDELFTSIVDACGAIGPVPVDPDGLNNRTPTSGKVMPHRGISGRGDLDRRAHSWGKKLARVMVKRIR